MASIVLTTLSLFLGFFFLFVGSVKVTPRINKDMHREIRRNFIQYAKVFPFAKTFNIKISPMALRLTVGWTEVITGITLILIPGILKQIANAILLCITIGAMYTHVMLDDKFERTAPSIVFTLMLLCRMIVYFQIKRKEKVLASKITVQESVSEKKEN